MFYSLGLPIGTFFYLSLVFIMYLVKKKFDDFQNKLFKYILFLTVILIFVEMIYIFTLSRINTYPILNEIVCRLFLTGVIVWTTSLFFYIWLLGKKALPIEKKASVERSIPLLIIIISSVLSIIDCFFRMEYITENGLYEIVGPATYILYIIAGVLITFLFVTLLINKNNYGKNVRIPIYVSLTLFVMDTIMHLYYFEINDLTLFLSLIVTSLYFTIESQDRMLLKEVAEAKGEAERVNKAKTDFLSNMSHEIRTPMNTILGFSNSLLLEDELSKDEVIEESKNIHAASISLLELINNILELSRLESQKVKMVIKEYHLSDILIEINNLLKMKTTEKNNWYDITINDNVPLAYKGDYGKILKILSSLILNAIKYTNYGYINLVISYENVNDKGYLVFEISNSGDKMPVDYYNGDFSDFSKLDYTSDNKLDSELLGVVISKRFVSMFEDSSILFSNNKEVTKCVLKIYQPKIGNELIDSDFLNKETNISNVDCTGKTVLIVDDNDINLKLAERLLKGYNFIITKVASGKECIDMVKLNDYDIIFLDHMMPEMDGIKTVHVLKSLNKKMPPVVAMTANSNPDSKDYYIKEGFDNYISKPINKSRLNKLIYEYFGGNK